MKQKNLVTSKKLSVCCKGTFSYHKGYTVSSINDKKLQNTKNSVTEEYKNQTLFEWSM